MALRVAINGFGRIGRQILQAGLNEKDIEWVAVNDLTDTKTLAHLLKYDSVFGRFPAEVQALEGALRVGSKRIQVLGEQDPAKWPWKKLKIDVVVESTGKYADFGTAKQHLKAGAKAVLVSAPCKGPGFTIVMGVNEHRLDLKKDRVVSNASCTTNGLAPMVKILNDALGIEKGVMLTTHSYTADQRLVDGPHNDLRRARAAAVNIIPTTTGAARTVGEVIPELKGKLDGAAWRVPTPDGSIVQFTAKVKKKTTAEHVNTLFEVASKKMPSIIHYSEEPLVLRDIIKDPHSCIFDALSTMVLDGDLVSVTGWYDNEWGFSCRMVDVLKLMGKQLAKLK